MRIGRLLAVSVVLATGVAIAPAATGSAGVTPSVAPSLRVGDSTVVEGDSGRAVVNVPVDLSEAPTTTVTVQFTISGQTATAGTDFVAKTGKLTFKPGLATKQLSVSVFGDTGEEGDEVVAVHLFNPQNATIDDGDGTVTIIDDDSDTYTGLQVSIGDVAVTASAGGTHLARLAVTLSQPAPEMIKVYYSVSCGYNATSGLVMKQYGTLTFQKNQQSKDLQFTVPLDQSIDEALSFVDSIKVMLGPAVPNQSHGEGLILDGSGSGSGPPPVGTVDRVSVASDGTEAQFDAPNICGGNSVRGSLQAAINGDGRYVVFTSDATNLVPDDTNALVDVFVHDRVTGSTERDSVFSDGSQVPGDIFNDRNTAFPTISADGRYVAFHSYRPLTSDGVHDGVYLHDRATGQTELISRATDGTPVSTGGASDYPAISDDGRYVTFIANGSLGTSAVPPVWPQSNNSFNLFVRDRVLGTTSLVSTSYNGGWTNGSTASMSGDGRYIAWTSDSPNITPDDTNGCVDVFVRDMTTGAVQIASLDNNGQQTTDTGSGCLFSYNGVLSADGRYVAFASYSPDLAAVPQPTGCNSYIYVRDLALGTTEFIGAQDAFDAGGSCELRNAGVPDISGDGRYVTYKALDMTTGDWAIFLYDRTTAETSVVGQLPDGTLPDGAVGDGFDWFKSGAISRDGLYVAFTSTATNLVTDANDAKDVFEQRIN